MLATKGGVHDTRDNGRQKEKDKEDTLGNSATLPS